MQRLSWLQCSDSVRNSSNNKQAHAFVLRYALLCTTIGASPTIITYPLCLLSLTLPCPWLGLLLCLCIYVWNQWMNRLLCSKCGAHAPQKDASRTFRHTPRALTPTNSTSPRASPSSSSIHIHHPSTQRSSSHHGSNNNNSNNMPHSAVSAAHMVLSTPTGPSSAASLSSMMAAASSAAHAQMMAAAIAASHAGHHSSSSGSISPIPMGSSMIGSSSSNQSAARSGKHPGDWICPTCADLNYNSR